MIFHPQALRTTILTTGFAALMAAALGNHACAGGNLDARYTVSFGRIRVGEITLTVVLGEICTWPRWRPHEGISGWRRLLQHAWHY